MRVIVAGAALLEISSSDPVLRAPTVGEYVAGTLLTPVDVPRWIGKGLMMVIRFRNGVYTSHPVVSAEVKGTGWSFDVF